MGSVCEFPLLAKILLKLLVRFWQTSSIKQRARAGLGGDLPPPGNTSGFVRQTTI